MSESESRVASEAAAEEQDEDPDEELSPTEYLAVVATSGLIGGVCFIVLFVVYWLLDSDARNSGVGFFLGLWRFFYPGVILAAGFAAIANIPAQPRSRIIRFLESRPFKRASWLGLIVFVIWLLGSC